MSCPGISVGRAGNNAAGRFVGDGVSTAMSTKIGPFEILSELAKSSTGSVYKANDPESGQTVALKAIQLSAFGEGAEALSRRCWPRQRAPKS